MIVCSCRLITDEDIKEAVEDILDVDPYAMLTPGVIFDHLDVIPNCSGCFPTFIDIYQEHQEHIAKDYMTWADEDETANSTESQALKPVESKMKSDIV